MYNQSFYNPPGALIVKGCVSKIEYKNRLINNRFKTEFYCPSSRVKNKQQKFVIWGRTSFNEGDELEMKGRFSDGVFYVCSHIVLKKALEQMKLEF